MLGKQGVIRLSPDEAVAQGLGICEGIEDGLAVLLSGWAPVWVATSAGVIARFPVLSGFESPTVFADPDEAGMNAALACADRWDTAGRETIIREP
jgi:AAA domain/Toprim domain